MRKIEVAHNYPEVRLLLKKDVDIVIEPNQELMEKRDLRVEVDGKTLYACSVYVKSDDDVALIARVLGWPTFKPFEGVACFMPRLKLAEARLSLDNIFFAGC